MADLSNRTTDWYVNRICGDRAKAVALMKNAGLLDSGGHRVFIQSASDRGRKLADGTPSGGRITESRIKRLTPDARGGGGGVPSGPRLGDMLADDGNDLIPILDRDFAPWEHETPPSQGRAARAWQDPRIQANRRRIYQDIQAGIRSGDADPEIVALIADLDALIQRGRLARDVFVWRGQRSAINTFGLESDDLSQLVGTRRPSVGLLGTSVHRAVAMRQFAAPKGPGGAFLLGMRAPKGIPAAWLRNLGRADMVEQSELLFGSGRSWSFYDFVLLDGTPTLLADLI